MPTLLALDRVLDRVLRRQAPEPFGHYQLLGRLGAGGMAEVFVAHRSDAAGPELVAVKRILPHLAEDERFVALFRREARITIQLSHRAIARVFDVGCVGATWFLAMELVPGESLAHLVRAERAAGKAPDARLVAHVGAEIASALAHAHALRDDSAAVPLEVVHRDVSPQNILLGFDGGVKLIDFGVARGTQLSAGTRTGTLRGKLAYASPEQVQGRRVDGRSDLFSLAVVLHEWLSGRPLFAREDDAATIHAVLHAPIPPVTVSSGLHRVLSRALDRDPARRFADGETMAAALRAAVAPALPAPSPAQVSPDATAEALAAHVRALLAEHHERWRAILEGGAGGPPVTAGDGEVRTQPGTPVAAPIGPRARGRRPVLVALALGTAGLGSMAVLSGKWGPWSQEEQTPATPPARQERPDLTAVTPAAALSAPPGAQPRPAPTPSTEPAPKGAPEPAAASQAGPARASPSAKTLPARRDPPPRSRKPAVARPRPSPEREPQGLPAPAPEPSILDELEPSPYATTRQPPAPPRKRR